MHINIKSKEYRCEISYVKIFFLVGDESQWVTGKTIRVNGGFI